MRAKYWRDCKQCVVQKKNLIKKWNCCLWCNRGDLLHEDGRWVRSQLSPVKSQLVSVDQNYSSSFSHLQTFHQLPIKGCKTYPYPCSVCKTSGGKNSLYRRMRHDRRRRTGQRTAANWCGGTWVNFNNNFIYRETASSDWAASAGYFHMSCWESQLESKRGCKWKWDLQKECAMWLVVMDKCGGRP